MTKIFTTCKHCYVKIKIGRSFTSNQLNVTKINYHNCLCIVHINVLQAVKINYHNWFCIICIHAYYPIFLRPSRDGSYYVIGMAGGRPHRFPHNNFSSVYRIFTKLSHMIPLWKGKNPIYFGVIRAKVKVTITINIIFDKVVSTTLVRYIGSLPNLTI